MLLVLDCVYPPESRREGSWDNYVDSIVRGLLSEERGNEILLCFGGFNLGSLDIRFFDSFIGFTLSSMNTIGGMVAQWLRASNIFRQLCTAGSVGRDLNLQKLNYQYLTTSVGVVLVVS